MEIINGVFVVFISSIVLFVLIAFAHIMYELVQHCKEGEKFKKEERDAHSKIL